MVEDRGKDEFSAQNLVKKLEILIGDLCGGFRGHHQAARGDGQAASRQCSEYESLNLSQNSFEPIMC